MNFIQTLGILFSNILDSPSQKRRKKICGIESLCDCTVKERQKTHSVLNLVVARTDIPGVENRVQFFDLGFNQKLSSCRVSTVKVKIMAIFFLASEC